MRAVKSDAAIVYSPLPSSQLKTQGMAAKLARAASPCTASFTLALSFFFLSCFSLVPVAVFFYLKLQPARTLLGAVMPARVFYNFYFAGV